MKTEEKQATIYGVKAGNTYHYIGKTIEKLNAKGNINKSDVTRQYTKPEIRRVFNENQDINVQPLKTIPVEDWYDEKLQEVVLKYGENHPLLNAQWMLDGKRGIWEGTGGYWQGKERDSYTLQRLSESKYKKVLQYDKEGNLLRIWGSGKEVGEKVFRDYRVVKGCGCTIIYRILDNNTLKGKYRKDCYWFREEEMLEYFHNIPVKLNLAVLLAEERKKLKSQRKPSEYIQQRKYVVLRYDKEGEDGELIDWYENTKHAAYVLRTSIVTVQRLCRGQYKNDNYVLKYGEKTLQPIIDVEYPKYKFEPLEKPEKVKPVKPRKECKKYQRTRTKYTVIQYDAKGEEMGTYLNVEMAAIILKIKPSVVRYICKGNKVKDLQLFLKYGEKKQVIYKG